MAEKGGKGFIKKVFDIVLTLGIVGGLVFGLNYLDDTYLDQSEDEKTALVQEELQNLKSQIQEKDNQIAQLIEEKTKMEGEISKKIDENQKIMEILKQEESSNGITLEQSNLQLEIINLSDKIAQQTEYSKEDRVAVEKQFEDILQRVDILVQASQIAHDNHQTILRAVENLKEINAMKNIIQSLKNMFESEGVEYSQNLNTISPDKGFVMETMNVGLCDKLYTYKVSGDKSIAEGVGKELSQGVVGDISFGGNIYDYGTSAKASFIQEIENSFMTEGAKDSYRTSYDEEKDAYIIEYRMSDGSSHVIECDINDEKLATLKISTLSQTNPYTMLYTFKELTKEQFDAKYDELQKAIDDAYLENE